MMYEELVKSLRICGNWEQQVRIAGGDLCDGCKFRVDGVCISLKGNKELLLNEAADAIEELQAAVEGYEANTDVQFVEHGTYSELKFVPKWIPVTERLPSAGQVLINLHYPDGFNEVSLGEHWNCPDIPEEDGWGGFGGNGVVTHWMPLPEPPKGDET